MTNDEEKAALDALLKANSPKQLAMKLDSRDNLRMHVEEDAKAHPLDEIVLTDEQWGRFSAHLLDGGGVLQDHLMLDEKPSLRDQLHSAIANGDRKATMHLLPHLVKSLLKRSGLRRQVQAGVSAGPIGGPLPASLVNSQGEGK